MKFRQQYTMNWLQNTTPSMAHEDQLAIRRR